MKHVRFVLVLAFVSMPQISSAMCRSLVPMMRRLSPYEFSVANDFKSERCARTTQQILTMFRERGNEKYMIGESISQEQHACQTAHIAWIAGADPRSIAAAALHDIGNFLGDSVGDAQEVQTTHAQRGAQWLEEHGFPQEVSDFARVHTYVKLWLGQHEPGYFEKLSRASQESYVAQKEQFKDEQEVNCMLLGVSWPTMIALRRCDDMAKLPHVQPHDLGVWAIFMQHSLLHHENVPKHPDWPARVATLQKLQTKKPEAFVRCVYGDEAERIDGYLK